LLKTQRLSTGDLIVVKTFSIFFLLFITLCSANVGAQQPKKKLTNADVIEMVKAGLPENTIILAIQQGPSDFDTSPSALIALKNQGISPKLMDAMLQTGPSSGSQKPENSTSNIQQSNNNPLSPGSSDSVSYGEVVMVDGDKRIGMTRSQLSARSGGFMMQAVNPFKKAAIQSTINGNHASLRTTNTSPVFEVGISSDLNPADYITLVKLKPRSDRREIETYRGGVTGISFGFRKEDIIPIKLEELQNAGGNRIKSYKVMTVTPIPPGEYALAISSGLLYDFGIDSNK
jgi:hypothetical protein